MKFKLHIKTILEKLLAQEDTLGDKKITIDDEGPGHFDLQATDGRTYTVKGTYYVSNVLQELAIALDEDKEFVELPLSKIEEPPVDRISRMIKSYYWDLLTRYMDESGIKNLIQDTKNKSLTADKLPIYVPYHDAMAFDYYTNLEAKYPIVTRRLPEEITPQYVKSINKKPGILSLKLEHQNHTVTGVPFVVPGGRFNEMYGWDSYFESVGLICDGRVELAKAMADNFQYEIEHYGKILNANRSYYLTRTQPPFYTRLIREVFAVTKDVAWLKSHLDTAIKEYETVWMVHGKRLTENGLNRYLAEGIGMTPEAEEGHYDAILRPYAEQLNCSIEDYVARYQNNEIENKDLDAYFLHDRTVRESGHDTSYRIEGNCADLNLVELNVLLYKYEIDFAELIQDHFGDTFKFKTNTYTGKYWLEKAEARKVLMNTYCWNEEKGLYLDYNHALKQQSNFVSATTFTPLWGGLASQEQARSLVNQALPLLKEKGGIAGSTEESRGDINASRPHRQWDYPNGWAPHQMMIWKGLIDYGFNREAQELIYRWLYMITRNAVDYNGTIPEKYDVVEATLKVYSEYGNVGTEFEYYPKGGFGWMNASYQYGVSLLDREHIQNLNNLVNPDSIF
ncbi:alpha,alpha-trehalase [Aestuariivivens sediminicola]|uniref:alpha,alpha-trehalase n=1 Tax=Aestuariivivens sediminicola TaxID=2913560 RepID=UPI001F571D43|nr:alpha,alpha-trehalase [Aestuariivivens sediminicola]